ncbi:MAG: beta-N-acetylhexosaminidase [Chitinophagaceae bacterium]|nr:MAG: beta-N-acetylhexosaminidase [Chitinophagaceae bacterium]
MRAFTLFLFCIFSFSLYAQVHIIPQPSNISIQDGYFIFNPKINIYYKEKNASEIAQYLSDQLKNLYGVQLNIKNAEPDPSEKIILISEDLSFPKEGYELTVTATTIQLKGTANGLFYAVQSLLQLFPAERITTTILIPTLQIVDNPRFQYRGLHLDVGRHFMPVSFIKKYIDYIAFHKMNYFHWHLTEDQGWRIEIKKYPNLTKIGSMRNGTIIGRYPGKGNDNIKYGGFYTQEQVKEIVKYASDRFITIIPEIELPGHSSAAIASYPSLSCFPDEPTKILENMISEESKKSKGKLVQETWGVFDDVFCAGKDATFDFLQNVIDELILLFPGKYFHVGGDECPKANWKRCPNCQQRMKENNLKDEHELQSYFIQRMEKYLNQKGKTLIGWDEILEGGLAPKAIVMSWRGEAGGIAAAKEKHEVIMTPGNPVYFDHTQTRTEDSVTIGGYNPLTKVYAYEPIPKELTEEEAKYVLGAQANVWTEYMKNEQKIEYMLFPRLSALSEVLWSPKEKRNWNDFENRLKTQYKRYPLLQTNYSKPYF